MRDDHCDDGSLGLPRHRNARHQRRFSLPLPTIPRQPAFQQLLAGDDQDHMGLPIYHENESSDSDDGYEEPRRYPYPTSNTIVNDGQSSAVTCTTSIVAVVLSIPTLRQFLLALFAACGLLIYFSSTMLIEQHHSALQQSMVLMSPATPQRPVVPPPRENNHQYLDAAAVANGLEDGRKRRGPYVLAITMLPETLPMHLPEWIEHHHILGIEKFILLRKRQGIGTVMAPDDAYERKRRGPDAGDEKLTGGGAASQSLNASTRSVPDMLVPYVRDGIVEYVPYPPEVGYSALTGDSVWNGEWEIDRWQEAVKRCVEAVETGSSLYVRICVEAAASEALARWRGRVRWIVEFGVDYYFIVPRAKVWPPKFEKDIIKISDVLRNLEGKDLVSVTGVRYGTQGYLESPSQPLVPDLPYTMISDKYSYHPRLPLRSDRLASGMEERKSFANPVSALSLDAVQGTWAIETSSSSLSKKSYRIPISSTEIKLNYFSPGVLNTPDFSPVSDEFLNEIPDTTQTLLVPMVRSRLIRRGVNNEWPHLPQLKPPSAHPPKAKVTERPRPPGANICVTFVHLRSPPHRFRRTVETTMAHFELHEPNLVPEYIIVVSNATLYSNDAIEVATSLMETHDIHHLRVTEPGKKYSEPALLDIAYGLCTAPHALSSIDEWHIRITPEPRPPSLHNIIADAIGLLEADGSLLEIWLGDVPDVSAYRNARRNAGVVGGQWHVVPVPHVEGQPQRTRLGRLHTAQAAPTVWGGWWSVAESDGDEVGKDDDDDGFSLASSSWFSWLWPGAWGLESDAYMGVYRSGGAVKSLERLRKLGPLAQFDKKTAWEQEVLFAKRAGEGGYSSLHLCVFEDACCPGCGVAERENRRDKATTGLMFRGRIMLNPLWWGESVGWSDRSSVPVCYRFLGFDLWCREQFLIV